MAKYDYGGGCPCGLYAECNPGCKNYRGKPMEQRRVNLDFPGPSAEAPNAALREIAGRLQKLSYRDMKRLAEVLFDALATNGNRNPPMRDALEAALLAVADKLEKA